MPKPLLASIALTLGTVLVGQNTAVLPPAFANLPGNAGVAMPLRWSRGKLQVFIDPVMLPSGFVGESITGLRLRRSMLDGSPAYPAMTRTLEVYGGFQPFLATQMNGSASQNFAIVPRQLLFGPAQVSVPATPAAGPTTTVGDDLVQISVSAWNNAAGRLGLTFKKPYVKPADQKTQAAEPKPEPIDDSEIPF